MIVSLLRLHGPHNEPDDVVFDFIALGVGDGIHFHQNRQHPQRDTVFVVAKAVRRLRVRRDDGEPMVVRASEVATRLFPRRRARVRRAGF